MPHPTWILAGALLLSPLSAAAQAPEPEAPAAAPAATFTDEQLRSYASASAEIDALHRAEGGDPAQAHSLQVTQQASAILQRNNIDVPTFNAIADRARTDTALAQRIQSLRGNAD